MPRNSGVSFSDASYSYRRSQGQSGCGCGAGAAEGCTGGCGQDPDIPVYDCTCQEEVPYRLVLRRKRAVLPVSRQLAEFVLAGVFPSPVALLPGPLRSARLKKDPGTALRPRRGLDASGISPDSRESVENLCVQESAVQGDGMDLPGEELAAVFQGSDGGVFETAAAGHLHPHDGHALDVVIAEDLGQLFAVVHGIQLGAADEGDMVRA